MPLPRHRALTRGLTCTVPLHEDWRVDRPGSGWIEVEALDRVVRVVREPDHRVPILVHYGCDDIRLGSGGHWGILGEILDRRCRIAGVDPADSAGAGFCHPDVAACIGRDSNGAGKRPSDGRRSTRGGWVEHPDIEIGRRLVSEPQLAACLDERRGALSRRGRINYNVAR